MEPFEGYARRIVSGLPPAEAIPRDQYRSPLEDPLSGLLDGQLQPLSIDPLNRKSDEPDRYPRIGSIESADIENCVLGSGLECMAFYKSIRHESAPPLPRFWGIFIFDYAVSYLANEITEFYSRQISANDAIRAALAFLYFHERFHFRFDAWAISQESSTGLPLYENYRNGVYRSFHPSEYVYEETLANLHALASIRSFGVHSFCKQFVLSQPGAYSNIEKETRQEFLARLAAQLFHGRGQFLPSPHFVLPEHVGYIAHHSASAQLDGECPVYLLQGVSPSRFLIPNISLPAISEIENGFLRKYLAGEEIQTDHKYFKIDNGEKIKCPNPHKKNVRLNEFNNIVGKAGLRTNEYFEQRQKTKGWRKEVPRPFPQNALFDKNRNRPR